MKKDSHRNNDVEVNKKKIPLKKKPIPKRNAFALLKPPTSKRNFTREIQKKLENEKYQVKEIAKPTKIYEKNYGIIYKIPQGTAITSDTEKVETHLACIHCSN
jgi:hypothetical protein